MISIHASAREATHPVSSKLLFHLISIHASAREATSRTFSLRPISHDFNPRLREGGDRLPLAILLESCHFNPRLREGGDKGEYASDFTEVISIHASAREATPYVPHRDCIG